MKVDRTPHSLLVICECGARFLFTHRIDRATVAAHITAAGCNPNQLPTGPHRRGIWGSKTGRKP